LPQDEVASLPESASERAGEDVGDDFELSMPAPNDESSSDDSSSSPVDIDALSSAKGASQEQKTAAESSPKDAGDELFNIAMKDEKQLQKQRRKRAQRGGLKTPGGGLIIFCPYGCRMVVKDSHRGMQGKCPECKAPFIVPIDPPDFSKKKEKSGTGEETANETTSTTWLQDLHLHTVNPEKLKLKADSLVKDFTLADFGFVNDQLVITVFNKKERGQLGKAADPRELVNQQLAAGKKVSDLEVSEKYAFSKTDVGNLKVVQPSASRADSIFHGIMVFGDGKIAIQLPAVEEKKEILYVSMGITQLWEFKKQAEEVLGVTGLGENAGIPPEQVFSTYRCHFTEMPIKALENLEFYKADQSVELETVGYQCGKCQIAVSEEGRKKESLGGKSPKGIAKAKSPKCTNKMGENLLQNVKAPEEAETAAT
ncbi:MAG: hypothetical protein HON04_18625, partial [Planctomicrobium sp.]|nr:hypothetical protein [Planctomicrobium sp.]